MFIIEKNSIKERGKYELTNLLSDRVRMVT